MNTQNTNNDEKLTILDYKDLKKDSKVDIHNTNQDTIKGIEKEENKVNKKNEEENEIENEGNLMEHEGCFYRTNQVFEFIVYPFIGFLGSILISCFYSSFFIALGGITVFIMIPAFIIVLFIELLSQNDNHTYCKKAYNITLWAFEKMLFGILLIFVGLGDSFLAVYEICRLICKGTDGGINPYKTATYNLGLAWTKTCIKCKELGLLEFNFDKLTKQEDNNYNDNINNLKDNIKNNNKNINNNEGLNTELNFVNNNEK